MLEFTSSAGALKPLLHGLTGGMAVVTSWLPLLYVSRTLALKSCVVSVIVRLSLIAPNVTAFRVGVWSSELAPCVCPSSAAAAALLSCCSCLLGALCCALWLREPRECQFVMTAEKQEIHPSAIIASDQIWKIE